MLGWGLTARDYSNFWFCCPSKSGPCTFNVVFVCTPRTRWVGWTIKVGCKVINYFKTDILENIPLSYLQLVRLIHSHLEEKRERKRDRHLLCSKVPQAPHPAPLLFITPRGLVRKIKTEQPPEQAAESQPSGCSEVKYLQLEVLTEGISIDVQ